MTATAILLGVERAAFCKVLMPYTNQRKATERNSGRKPKLSERDRCTLQRIMSENHGTTATTVTTELIIYLDPLSTKTFRRERHKSYLHGRAAITKPLITENNS